MCERPILFSGPMVRAILDGRKTQTRRVVKPQPMADMCAATPDGAGGFVFWNVPINSGIKKFTELRYRGEGITCPYGKPGDRLWVRESWYIEGESQRIDEPLKRVYVAYKPCSPRAIECGWHTESREVRLTPDTPMPCQQTPTFRAGGGMRWRPSIHMPRWASRILLEIVSVRVERLNDISDADAQAEGILDADCIDCDGWVNAFSRLWEQINGAGSWDANPWVWVVEFKVIKP